MKPTKEELIQGMKNMDDALLPRDQQGNKIPMFSPIFSATEILYPYARPDENGCTHPMYFAEDFINGVPDWLTYELGYERPNTENYLDSIVYINPDLNQHLGPRNEAFDSARHAKLVPDQVKTSTTVPAAAIETPRINYAYEESGCKIEPMGDGLFLIQKEGPVRVSNFVLHILEHRYIYGRNQDTEQELRLAVVVNRNEKELLVNCRMLDGIAKIIQDRIPEAILSVGLSKGSALLCNYVRSMIPNAAMKKVYRSTGFEKVDGRWVYVHDNAPVSSPSIEFRTGNSIGFNPGISAQAAFQNAMGLMSLSLKAPLIIPLVLEAHLAPLFELYSQAGHVPRWVLFLNGTTGSLKTSMSMCIFKLFQEQSDSPESNFNDTPTALEVKLANTHSRVLVVDDFQPPVSAASGKIKLERLEMIIRFVGDRIGKSRSNCELTLVQQRPPACCCVVTGEDTGGSESSLLRCLVLGIRKGDINGEILKRYQDDPLMLQTHFYYFLMWCGQHAESIISRIRNCFDEERAFFGQVIKEPRLIDTGVSLRLIAGILLEYGADIGAISNASQLYDEWTNALCTALQLSEQHSKSSNPLSMYFQALFDLINSGKISVAASVDVYTANKYIGYVEKDYWWLRSRDVFLEVRKYWQNFGVTFPLSDVKISESLVDNALILPDYEKRNGRIRILYGRKSSLPGRPRMMVLNPAAARNYLEKAHGND